jgi:hypothetical protein
MKVSSFSSTWYKRLLSAFILSLISFFLVNLSIAAWTPPSGDPPNNNTLAPIDTSNNAQSRQGNLGIGISPPAYKLDVGGKINTNDAFCISGVCVTDFNRYWSPANDKDIFNSSLGNVGVGVASPQALLDIADKEATSSYFLLRVSSTTPDGVTPEDPILFSVEGNGKTTVEQLHINGGFEGSPTGTGWRQYQDPTSGNFDLAYILDTGATYLDYANALTITPLSADGVYKGNVGIGNTAPKAKLQVTDSGGAVVALSPGSSASGSSPQSVGMVKFLSRDDTSANYWSGIEGYRKGNADQTDLRFYTQKTGEANPTEKVRVADDGNVGIGTQTPTEKLSVNGKVTASAYCISGNCMSSWNDVNGYWQPTQYGIKYSSSTASTVGIGVNAPDSLDAMLEVDNDRTGNGTKLRITDNDNGSVDNPELQLQYGNLNNHWGIYVQRDNNAALNFWNGDNRLTLTSDGKLGIGTTGPNYKLEVSGSGYFADDLTLANQKKLIMKSSVGGDVPVLSMNASNNVVLSAASNSLLITSGGVTAAKFYSNGNVGIGVDPLNYKLDVWGKVNAEEGFCISGDCVTGWADITGINYWDKTGSDISYSTGNVGVGVVTPSEKLEVSGNAKATRFRSNRYLNLTDTDTSEIQFGNVANGAVSLLTSGQQRLFIKGDGNVGIGNTAPGTKLSVTGSGSFTGTISASNFSGSSSGTNTGDETQSSIKTKLGAASAGVDGYLTGTDWSTFNSKESVLTFSNGLTRTGNNVTGTNYWTESSGNINRSSGNVGIGVSNPTSYKLDVAGQMNASTGLCINGDCKTAWSQVTGSNYWTLSGSNINYSGGNVGVGVSAATQSLEVSKSGNTDVARIKVTDIDANQNPELQLQYGSTASEHWAVYVDKSDSNTLKFWNGDNNLTITPDGNVTVLGTISANKFDYTTIDPPYKINNQTYATYGASMVGVKEEYSAVVRLQKVGANYQTTLSFANQAEGSDLWLFAKVTNLSKVFDDLAVQLTANFAGQVWYEKNPKTQKVTIYATPNNENIKQLLEVSLRLTAPRYDYEKWENTREPSSVGHNLDEFYKNEK